VQEFWSEGELDQKIPSGAHYPQGGGSGTEFRAHWYDSAPPLAARVNIDGQFHTMIVETGSDGNATYLFTADIPVCSWYYFSFRDASGKIYSYPGTGAFGVGCGDDWRDTRP
jgi:hypothetical protein